MQKALWSWALVHWGLVICWSLDLSTGIFLARIEYDDIIWYNDAGRKYASGDPSRARARRIGRSLESEYARHKGSPLNGLTPQGSPAPPKGHPPGAAGGEGRVKRTAPVQNEPNVAAAGAGAQVPRRRRIVAESRPPAGQRSRRTRTQWSTACRRGKRAARPLSRARQRRRVGAADRGEVRREPADRGAGGGAGAAAASGVRGRSL